MSDTPMIGMLKNSSLHALLMLTSKALTRSGYGDVQILDRRAVQQKSRFGGHELLCQTTIGSLEARVIVKVINDTVRLRMMDEMAGAILRTRSDLGLIITPHHITKTARNQQMQYGPSRIEVLDGHALEALLIKNQIGTRSNGVPDYAFFSSLEDISTRLLSFLEGNRV